MTEELIDTLADMLRVVEADPSDAELGRQVKSTVARHGDLAELLAGCLPTVSLSTCGVAHTTSSASPYS
ncbi:MAG: hypothetical protein JO352_39700 [Chloroflexi bacterium]|nr:hypothetical protein [Chloroflexota bacterium]